MFRSYISFIILLLAVSAPVLGQNIPRANYSGPYGVQVNTYNGNLYLEYAALSIPNQDLPIGLSFSFNSFRDSIDLGYGYGWTHSYALRCQSVENGIVIQRTHGRRDTFAFVNDLYVAPPGIFDELTADGSGGFELQTKYGMTYYFADPDHHYVTSIENTNGQQLSLGYTDSLLTSITDASERGVSLNYSGGHLSGIVDDNYPGGRAWALSYTAGNQLGCIADPDNNCVSFNYDDQGRMITYVEERGYELAIRYDRANRVSTLQTCILTTNFAYNREQFRTSVIEQNGQMDQITTYVYDEEGKLTQKTGNCCGYDMSYEYDSENNLSELTDANGNTLQSSFDQLGNTVATQDALAQQQQFSFGDLSRLSSFTDKRGNSSSFEYDENGNLIRIAQPLGVEIVFGYDINGNVERITDGEGNMTSMNYNDQNELVEVIYEIGSETYEYDLAGNLTSMTDGNNNPVAMEYDALNRLRLIRDALGNEIQYDYDAASNLTSETDAENNAKNYEYDAHNRLVSVQTPIGTTRYDYDPLDNLTRITNAEGHAMTFAYDTRSRLTAESDAMGFTTRYAYDNNGNVIQRLDANLQATNYTYDGLNRLTQKQYPGNTDNYTYDSNGNLIRCSNNHISYVFTYDALNRMTSKTVENWGLTIRYEYDRAGNRNKMIDPSSGETIYTYDGNNRMTSILNPNQELTQFEYDPGGRLTRQHNFNGTRAEYTYDQANRLLSLVNLTSTDSVLSSYAYTYDGNGLRTSMTDHTGGTATYQYDGENRLTHVVYTDGTEEIYTFDKAGNRTSLTRNGETITYNYDAADRIQSAGTTNYDFDGNGNMIRKTAAEGTTIYQYDGENRLIQVTLPTGETVEYQYDPFGDRIGKGYADETTHYFLDGENVLMELDENNAVLARYTAGLAYDSWISMERAGSSYVYHTDALGSTTGLSNGNGSLSATYAYDAYGNILSQTGDVENVYRYTGREWDEILELYYFRERWYNEKNGRFASKDIYKGEQLVPISQNTYSAVENDPINKVDKDGLSAEKNWFEKTLGAFESFGRWTIRGITGWFDWGEGDNYFGTQFCGPGPYGKNLKEIKSSSFLDYTCKQHDLKYGKYGAEGPLDAFLNFCDEIIKADLDLAGGAFVSLLVRDTETFIGSISVSSLFFAITAFKVSVRSIPFIGDAVASNCKKSQGNQKETENENNGGGNDPDPDNPGDVNIPIIRSFDPNEIIGPEGVGQEKWVKQTATLPYTILFENDPDFATGAAQQVSIFHPYDDSVNPVSFRLGDFGFGDYYFQVPDDLSYYDTRIDLTDSLGIFLDVIAGIDVELNRAFWVFESIDPATGLAATLPANLGFLPVNDSLTRAGEGFVNFTIKPRLSAATGDQIEAQASIIFDDNPAIATNIAINTIDGTAPESHVTDIDTLGGGNYRLFWQGGDVGSGLADFTLFTSTNLGAFVASAGPFRDSLSYIFQGDVDSTYRFFTIVRDSVGNVEPLKNFGEPACMEVRIDSLVNEVAGQNNGLIRLEVDGNIGPLNFEWSHDMDLNTGIAAGLASGNYQVIVSDSVGCEVALSIVIDLIDATVEGYEDLFIYQLFPVPASDQMKVQFRTNDSVVAITITDLQGRKLLLQNSEVIPNQVNIMTLAVGHLPAGSYLLRLQSRDGTVTSMFSKL